MASNEPNEPSLLPISTRGIGMGVAHLYWMLSTCEYLRKAVPPICSIYRAALGHLEYKLAHVQSKCDKMLSESDRALQYKSEFPLNFDTVPLYPRSLADLFNAVGYLTHETGNYVPTVHRRVYENNRYVPRTDNILFSNLRETVLALSDPNTPVEYRRSFFKNNPIPGARFQNDLLLNPDDVMPPNFGISDRHVGGDMDRVMHLVDKIEYRFGNILLRKIHKSRLGKQSLLVSSTQGDLAIPSMKEGQSWWDYYRECKPVGDVTDFCANCPVEYASTVDDPALLLGEVPNERRFITPFYDLRNYSCNERVLLYREYQEICSTIYAPYSKKSMPINLREHENVTNAIRRYCPPRRAKLFRH